MAQEIERKFLVLNDSYKRESFSHSRIQQGYITSERGRTVRIRIRDEKAYITIKGPSLNGGLFRYEFEQEIPMDDARQLMALCEPGIIDKTRVVQIPDFIGDEVTGDRRYYNSQLRQHPYKEWAVKK